jgi:putative endonuclease
VPVQRQTRRGRNPDRTGLLKGLIPGFTQRYGIKTLVWYETFSDAQAAIHRETRLKKFTRKRKVDLIESVNPQWLDLAEGP